jgi:RecB family exonuclease
MYDAGCVAHDSIISDNRWAEIDIATPHGSAGIEVTARIDRADRLAPDHYQLIDWKTGRYESDEAADEQLDIAHITLRRARSLPAETRVTAVGWNLRSGKRRVRELTRDDAVGTLEYLVGAAARMRETEEFEPTPSKACNFCEFRLQCEDAYLAGPASTDARDDGDDLFDPLDPAADNLLPFD